MKVAVLIKQTPDTAELPKVSAEEVRSGNVNVTMVINPWDEFAAEEAVLLGENNDAESVAIGMGKPDAVDALKHALAMGVNQAVLVDNSNLRGDLWTTANALAAAIRQQGPFDLVLAGKQSVDDNSGAVFAGVAAQLGVPLLVNVSKIKAIDSKSITVDRLVDGGEETVSAPLPAVVSVSKEINTPRYPSFMGIRKAGKAKIPVLGASDLAVQDVGPRTRWGNIRKPETRKTTVKIIEGASAAEKAANLVDALLAEKVI